MFAVHLRRQHKYDTENEKKSFPIRIQTHQFHEKHFLHLCMSMMKNCSKSMHSMIMRGRFR